MRQLLLPAADGTRRERPPERPCKHPGLRRQRGYCEPQQDILSTTLDPYGPLWGWTRFVCSRQSLQELARVSRVIHWVADEESAGIEPGMDASSDLLRHGVTLKATKGVDHPVTHSEVPSVPFTNTCKRPSGKPGFLRSLLCLQFLCFTDTRCSKVTRSPTGAALPSSAHQPQGPSHQQCLRVKTWFKYRHY
jgi:hypothetical protein